MKRTDKSISVLDNIHIENNLSVAGMINTGDNVYISKSLHVDEMLHANDGLSVNGYIYTDSISIGTSTIYNEGLTILKDNIMMENNSNNRKWLIGNMKSENDNIRITDTV